MDRRREGGPGQAAAPETDSRAEEHRRQPLRPGFRRQLIVGSYWLYDALGVRICVYRANEYAPQRPLVFVLEVTGEELQRRRRAPAMDVVLDEPPVLQSVRYRGPAPASIPHYDAPPITHSHGRHHLELVADGGPLHQLSDILVVRGREGAAGRVRGTCWPIADDPASASARRCAPRFRPDDMTGCFRQPVTHHQHSG